MPSRSLMSGLLLLVVSTALAGGSSFAGAPAAAPSGSPEASADGLRALEASWSSLRESLALEHPDGLPLCEQLAPSIARAIARLEPALGAGELSPHRAAAGLASVVLDSARLGGADPRELASLEILLRETLPRLLGDRAPQRPAVAPVGRKSPWPTRSSAGLPERIALELRGELSPSAGAPPR